MAKRPFLIALLLLPLFSAVEAGLFFNDDQCTNNGTVKVCVWYCSNDEIHSRVTALLFEANGSKDVDSLQADLETSLDSYFKSDGGQWLVSVSAFDRSASYIDDAATKLPSFCSIFDDTSNVQVLVVKVS